MRKCSHHNWIYDLAPLKWTNSKFICDIWTFKNNINATETAKKNSNAYVYVLSVITDHKVPNWFSKFPSEDTSLRDEPRLGRSSDLDEDILRELVECNPRKSSRELAFELNTSQSTIYRKQAWRLTSSYSELEKIRKIA